MHKWIETGVKDGDWSENFEGVLPTWQPREKKRAIIMQQRSAFYPTCRRVHPASSRERTCVHHERYFLIVSPLSAIACLEAVFVIRKYLEFFFCRPAWGPLVGRGSREPERVPSTALRAPSFFCYSQRAGKAIPQRVKTIGSNDGYIFLLIYLFILLLILWSFSICPAPISLRSRSIILRLWYMADEVTYKLLKQQQTHVIIIIWVSKFQPTTPPRFDLQQWRQKH